MSPPRRLAKPKPRLCSCGRDFPGAGGLCRACYRARAHSRSALVASARRFWSAMAASAGPVARPDASTCITGSRA